MWSASLRTFMVTSHVTSSVGWLGAVLAFLVLSLAAILSTELMVSCSAYVAMNLIGWAAIVPLAAASFVSGVVLGLGTDWGLMRHRWILTKLIATTVLLIGLLVHQFTAVSRAADLARNLAAGLTATTSPLDQIGVQLVIDAGFAALFLIGITALSFIKPWGRTTIGKTRVTGSPPPPVHPHARLQLGVIIVIAIALMLSAFVMLHVVGGISQHGH